MPASRPCPRSRASTGSRFEPSGIVLGEVLDADVDRRRVVALGGVVLEEGLDAGRGCRCRARRRSRDEPRTLSPVLSVISAAVAADVGLGLVDGGSRATEARGGQCEGERGEGIRVFMSVCNAVGAAITCGRARSRAARACIPTGCLVLAPALHLRAVADAPVGDVVERDLDDQLGPQRHPLEVAALAPAARFAAAALAGLVRAAGVSTSARFSLAVKPDECPTTRSSPSSS